MAAPTNAAKREKNPCQPGAVHTWAQNGPHAISDLSPECAPSGRPSTILNLWVRTARSGLAATGKWTLRTQTVRRFSLSDLWLNLSSKPQFAP
jgi:hypothetical protein